HAAARSRVSHGSLYGPPIAAVSIATLCSCATFRSPHTAGVLHFCHRVLADYGPPIAAARPVICHGPSYRLLMLLPGPQSLMGPCTASHCCCLHRHTLPCATFRSPHTAGGFHFVIGCWQASHCCCLHRHTLPCATFRS
ncbi:unnamed protein product, partial [Staurois parvus]